MTVDDPASADPRLDATSAWLAQLQGKIVAAMEALEREFAGVDAARPPGRFVLEPWARTDASGAPGGGGRMAMLRGRLFATGRARSQHHAAEHQTGRQE